MKENYNQESTLVPVTRKEIDYQQIVTIKRDGLTIYVFMVFDHNWNVKSTQNVSREMANALRDNGVTWYQ